MVEGDRIRSGVFQFELYDDLGSVCENLSRSGKGSQCDLSAFLRSIRGLNHAKPDHLRICDGLACQFICT